MQAKIVLDQCTSLGLPSIKVIWGLHHYVFIYFYCFLVLGDQSGADIGPLITPQAKDRVNRLIQSGVDEGASLLLDGRSVKVKGFENGNFVGPTIISNVTVSHLWVKKIEVASELDPKTVSGF